MNPDRRAMPGRARFLQRLIDSALMIDMPGHGESGGEWISYGPDEAVAAASAWHALRETRPGDRYAAIGTSRRCRTRADTARAGARRMGDESMFPTLEAAVRQSARLTARRTRLRSRTAGAVAMPRRLGTQRDDRAPIEVLPIVHAPILIVSDTADRSTTTTDTQRLYARTAAPKRLWWAAGAGHVDLHAAAGAAYAIEIGTFLSDHLRGTADTAAAPSAGTPTPTSRSPRPTAARRPGCP